MRRRYGMRWSNNKTPIDIQNRHVKKKLAASASVEVRLNWFSKTLRTMKFKYDHSDCKWVDVDTVISTVTLNYNAAQKLYSLEPTDFRNLNEFMELWN
jgi:hypothetical protein